ncbi:hypothetical protein [Bacillus sp. REN10]|uniref:hypothetical protein n=1 Tax=Bacillus sp. REN10 TaxID=2782541 RepID=UPI001EEE051E|nr:hypothetical protein [Bacillus sp. REN10]
MPTRIGAHLCSSFSIHGFKGVNESHRTWNGAAEDDTRTAWDQTKDAKATNSEPTVAGGELKMELFCLKGSSIFSNISYIDPIFSLTDSSSQVKPISNKGGVCYRLKFHVVNFIDKFYFNDHIIHSRLFQVTVTEIKIVSFKGGAIS